MMRQIVSPSSKEILYEHEIVRSEGNGERVLRLGFGLFWIVFTLWIINHFIEISKMSLVEFILILSAVIIYTYIANWRFGMPQILLIVAILTIFSLVLEPMVSKNFAPLFFAMSLCIFPLSLLILKFLIYNSKIKLTLTGTELLIRAPDGTLWALASFINLTFLIGQEIRNVSIKDTISPELKGILHDQTRFKVQLNTKLRHHTYLYVFVLSRQDIQNIQFVDLELQDQKHILIEFDDATNFLCIFKQRMSGKSNLSQAIKI